MPRRTLSLLLIVLLLLSALALLLGRAPLKTATVTEERCAAGRFGNIHLYRRDQPPWQLILLISGDDGWQQNMDALARTLATPGVLVAGLDLSQYRNGVSGSSDYCDYPAGTLAALSRELQQNVPSADWRPPLLVGYAGGATLAYVALAQSPGNTFRGAISLDFRPTLRLTKPLCKGLGALKWSWRADGHGMDFQPAALPAPWIVLQNDAVAASSRQNLAAFVHAVPQAKWVVQANTADPQSTARNMRTALAAAAADFLNAAPPPATSANEPLDDLPLVDLTAAATRAGAEHYLAVVISGDGGWADIDRDIGDALSTQGIPVVGWDSLHYFWARRTPERAGQDLTRVIEHYLSRQPTRQLLLIGYSLGADVLPFMVNRLPKEMKDRVALVALLGISPSMDFEFRIADWLPGKRAPAPYPTRPEVDRLAPLKVLCVYGENEKDSLCPQLIGESVTVRRLPGGHHFDGDYRKLTRIILDTARVARANPVGDSSQVPADLSTIRTTNQTVRTNTTVTNSPATT